MHSQPPLGPPQTEDSMPDVNWRPCELPRFASDSAGMAMRMRTGSRAMSNPSQGDAVDHRVPILLTPGTFRLPSPATPTNTHTLCHRSLTSPCFHQASPAGAPTLCRVREIARITPYRDHRDELGGPGGKGQ